MALEALKTLIRQDLAIDLGTANTLVYLEGEGIVLREPTVIAISRDKSVVALGQEAKAYLGKAPPKIQVSRPMKAGIIEDLEAVSLFIREIVAASKKRKSFLTSRVVVCIPSKLTQLEKRGVLDACKEAGFKKVYLLEEAMAAAIGAGLDISEKRPSLIVDIGGGTTEIAVISQKRYLMSDSRRIGGDDMDEALIQAVLERYALKIGPNTAERLKWDLGCLDEKYLDELSLYEVAGQCMAQQSPDKAVVDGYFVMETIKPIADDMALAIKEGLDRLDRETKKVVEENGLILTGGVSLLRGCDSFFERALGLNVKITPNPLETVVIGAGNVLSNFKYFKDVFVN